jgi:hypothetical protein
MASDRTSVQAREPLSCRRRFGQRVSILNGQPARSGPPPRLCRSRPGLGNLSLASLSQIVENLPPVVRHASLQVAEVEHPRNSRLARLGCVAALAFRRAHARPSGSGDPSLSECCPKTTADRNRERRLCRLRDACRLPHFSVRPGSCPRSSRIENRGVDGSIPPLATSEVTSFAVSSPRVVAGGPAS